MSMTVRSLNFSGIDSCSWVGDWGCCAMTYRICEMNVQTGLALTEGLLVFLVLL